MFSFKHVNINKRIQNKKHKWINNNSCYLNFQNDFIWRLCHLSCTVHKNLSSSWECSSDFSEATRLVCPWLLVCKVRKLMGARLYIRVTFELYQTSALMFRVQMDRSCVCLRVSWTISVPQTHPFVKRKKNISWCLWSWAEWLQLVCTHI